MNRGLLDQVNELMQHADPMLSIAWNEAPSFRRDSPALHSMAEALNLSEEEVDALFAEALTVQV